jgi:hypothetical protein
LFGFLLAVGNLRPGRKYERAVVTSAAFASRSQQFDSRKTMDQQPNEDGTILVATVEPTAALQFLNAFLAGGFEISFARSNRKNARRTYSIQPAPSDQVRENFFGCLEKLMPAESTASVQTSTGK